MAVRTAPLRVGDRGRYEGARFVVRGGLVLRHTSGARWTEWYASFEDGRGGWIAPSGDRAIVTFPAELPTFRSLRTGRPAWHAYVVEEKGRARYESAEGALPFAPAFGASYAYADLRGPEGAFATIDYSEEPPRLFLGKVTPFAALHLTSPRTSPPRAHPRRRTR